MSKKTEVKFWNPGLSYKKIKKEIDTEIERVLTNGDLILREDVEEFEKNLAEYLGVDHVVSVASCTDALLLALKASKIGAGDDVLVPSYTFRATVEAIHHAGARPILYDMGGDYKNRVTKRTVAIIPAHLEGVIWDDMGELATWATERGLTIIEDSAQAIGASPLVGSMACYSFYPAKILGCYGDGGAIATNNLHLASHLRQLRNHYKDNWGAGYGYNSRLDNLQAAVLNVKLRYLPSHIARRKEIAQKYDQYLVGVGLPEEREVYQDYIIFHPETHQLQLYLKEHGIDSMRNFYPFPDDLQKGPNATSYESQTLRIPCNPDLTDEEVDYVIEVINAYGKS